LPCPKASHANLSSSVNTLLRMSSKTSALRAAKKHWRVFYSLASWQCTSSHRIKHESLKSCHITSISWNTPTLPSNGLCEFLDRGRIVVLFRVFPVLGRVWAAFRDEVPETLMTKIDPGKCMISVIWSFSGIHGRLALTKGMTHNFHSFCQQVIPDIQPNICSSSRRKALKDFLFSCILTMHQLTIRDFLQKTLNPWWPKECRVHFRAKI
jgi:hypothetical protein